MRVRPGRTPRRPSPPRCARLSDGARESDHTPRLALRGHDSTCWSRRSGRDDRAMSSGGEGSTAPGCLDDQQIVALVEGKLSAAARAEVEEHLDACDTCQRLVAAVLGSPTV